MANDISTGLKTRLFYGNAGDTVDLIATEVPEINSLGDLTDEAAEISVPTYNSEYTRTLPGQKTASAFEATLNWSPANTSHAAMKSAYDNRTKHGFKIQMEDGVGGTFTAHFEGYVTAFTISNPVDNVRTAAMKISIDGGYTITVA